MEYIINLILGLIIYIVTLLSRLGHWVIESLNLYQILQINPGGIEGMMVRSVSSMSTILIFYIVLKAVKNAAVRSRLMSTASKSGELSANEFLNLRSSRTRGKNSSLISSTADFQGVYILHNVDRDMCYVGQSVRVFSRINNHFTGHGNGEVYRDFRNGDHFTVKTIPLQGSGFKSLNSLERQTISAYKAYRRGYNKTRGNDG